MHCKICSGRTEPAFTTTVLRKYAAEFRLCSHCGFLFAAEPHWLDEAYGSVITDADVGLVQRNLYLRNAAACLLAPMREAGGRFVDAGGGTGLFVRLMRDIGYDFYWADPYCANVHARGLEFDPSSRGAPIACVTAFEVIEHSADPLEFVRGLLQAYGTDTLLLSTEVWSGDRPPAEWHYYGFEHGQHISFLQQRTLAVIADRLGMKLSSAGMIHLMGRSFTASGWRMKCAKSMRGNAVFARLLGGVGGRV